MGRSTFGRGRLAFSRARLFSPTRRVVVKARVVRHKGRAFRSAPLTAHLSYLKRDGVTRSGERAEMFDARGDGADSAAFAERCKDDRHHFRFIVSPEDAGDMTDLKAFTRDLAKQMEADFGTRLDWVAVDHWNTDNPHVHLLVRGVDEEGADLVISRDYISRGLRSRAEELVAIELGPKPEHEIRNSLEREVSAERWTRLDREVRLAAEETGYIDLRPKNPGSADPEIRRLMVGRLQHLEKMGPCRIRRTRGVDGRTRGRAQLARPRHARRHHQDHAPRLYRARGSARRRRLRHRGWTADVSAYGTTGRAWIA
jgi:type IV secretory pathway VirD2 relaxase